MGEGVGNEAQLMPLVSSCNIACGGHAGNKAIMRSTIQLAKKHGAKIGAHPGYPDTEKFGRVVLNIPIEELIRSIKDQLRVFTQILKEEGGELHHIKPHGALYNELAKNETLAKAFLQAIEPYTSGVFLYVPPGSVIEKLAKISGVMVKREAFADRNYNDDLSLVSRSDKNALIMEPKQVLSHLKVMINEGVVETVSGKKIGILAETFCVHGDTPSALKILMYLHRELPNYQLKIA